MFKKEIVRTVVPADPINTGYRPISWQVLRIRSASVSLQCVILWGIKLTEGPYCVIGSVFIDHYTNGIKRVPQGCGVCGTICSTPNRQGAASREVHVGRGG